jgi:hypothetical protein
MFQDNAEIAASALKDMAMVAMGFYKELLAQGFNEDQAWQMVMVWQKGMMGVKS